MVRRVIQIHDEMPLAWNSDHRSTEPERQALVDAIARDAATTGIWILAPELLCSPETVRGMIWASLKKNRHQERICSIASFWIDPSVRNQDLAPILTLACLAWAKETCATALECATHFKNSRMREILEEHGFQPGMLQYSLDLKN